MPSAVHTVFKWPRLRRSSKQIALLICLQQVNKPDSFPRTFKMIADFVVDVIFYISGSKWASPDNTFLWCPTGISLLPNVTYINAQGGSVAPTPTTLTSLSRSQSAEPSEHWSTWTSSLWYWPRSFARSISFKKCYAISGILNLTWFEISFESHLHFSCCTALHLI